MTIQIKLYSVVFVYDIVFPGARTFYDTTRPVYWLLHFLSIQGGGVDGLLQGVLNQKFPGPNNMENYMRYNCRSFRGHCFLKKTEFPGAI